PAARLDEQFDIKSRLLSNTNPAQLSSLGPNWLVMVSPYFEGQQIYDAFVVSMKATKATGKLTPSNDPAEAGPGAFVSPYMWDHDAVFSDGRLCRGPYVQDKGPNAMTLFRCPSDDGSDVPYAGVGGGWGRGNYAINAG